MKKTLSVLLIVFYTGHYLKSQNELDSLKLLLSTNHIHDTVRANTLCQLSWIYGDIDAKLGMETGISALNFAKKHNLTKNIGFAYNSLGYNANMLGQNALALKYYFEAIGIWRKMNDSLRIARLYSNIGNVYSEIPTYDSAIKYYNLSINICKTNNYDKALSSAYLNLASLYISRNKFEESVKLLLKSLKIKEKLNDNQGIANICTHLSAVYKEQKKYDLSLKYGYQSAKIWSALGNSNGLSYTNLGIGLIFYKLNSLDSALIYTQKALINFEVINNQLGIATAYNRLGQIYDKLNQTEKAIFFFEKSKKNSTNPLINESYAEACAQLANLYTKTKQNKAAESNLAEALKYTDSDIQKNTLVMIYQTASKFYEENNNYKKALLYNKLHFDLYDSLEKAQNFIATTELQLKFETEKKEKENIILKNENNLKTTQLNLVEKKRIYYLTVAAIIIITILIVFILLFKNYKSKQTIKEQELISNASFESEIQERTRIARDLHDGIAQKLVIAKMQLNLEQTDTKTLSRLLDESINEIRNVSHNLMPDDLSKGIVIAIENLCEMVNILNSKTQASVDISDSFKSLVFNKRLELYIYRIIQEIISNALKYANASLIDIKINYQKSQIELSISDNGVGFNDDQEHESSENTGLGLRNITNRVSQLKGRCHQKSEINKGTEYFITIPY